MGSLFLFSNIGQFSLLIEKQFEADSLKSAQKRPLHRMGIQRKRRRSVPQVFSLK